MEGEKIYRKLFKKIEEWEKQKKQKKPDAFKLLEKFGQEAIKAVIVAKKRARQKNPNYSEYIFPLIRKIIKKSVVKQFDFSPSIEIPPLGIDADFAVPCFQIAQTRKQDLQKVKKTVALIIKNANIPLVSEIKIVGNYVNISLDKKKLARVVIQNIEELGGLYGSSEEGKGKRIIIDYSSPGVAKPMSVGHLRSTIIGNSLKKLYEYQGYVVVGVNHLGDWGTQFGKLLWSFQEWGNRKDLKKDSISVLFNLYVRFHKEAEKNPILDQKAREIFRRLEQGDIKLLKQWAEFCDLSIKELGEIYNQLEVDFNLILGESFYHKKTDAVVNECLSKNIASKGEHGSFIINLKKFNLPIFLLRKADEASLYMTRDLAAAELRIKAFHPAKIIYVVGNEQKLYFKQLFKTLELLGYDFSKFEHIGFGLISLPEGKISTRKGRVIFLEEILKEAVKRAKSIVKIKNPNISANEIDNIAKVVGIGAVIFNDLFHGREKNIIFQWEKILNLEGNSAPYIQYGYVRAMSILEKSKENIQKLAIEKLPILINLKSEANIIKLLALFPEITRQAQQLNAPHLIAIYLNTLVQEFNRFYTKEPVLQASKDIRKSRLRIVNSVAKVIKNGLELLGIKIIKRM